MLWRIFMLRRSWSRRRRTKRRRRRRPKWKTKKMENRVYHKIKSDRD